jgi:polyisoprenyl-phosphate glycosyltransferase
MLKEWQNGAEIVEGVRNDYGKTCLLKRITSDLYYKFLGWLSSEKVTPGVSDYRLIDKKVARVLKGMNEQPLYLRGLFSWMGFPIKRIPYEVGMRKHGKTKYTFRKMMTLAMAGVTGMSIKPLRLSLLAGIVISVFAFFYALYALYVSFYTPYTVEGWTSIIISILLLSGFQLIILGILGEYLGKLFIENKGRPGYIIACSNIEGV